MVYRVKVLSKKFEGRAVICINYTTLVGMDVLVVGRNTEGNRLFCKVSLQLSYVATKRKTKCITKASFIAFDFDVGGLGGRVQAIGRGSIFRS